MYASVRAFLDQIIDYAGLFPPAKLPLDRALQTYLRDRKDSPHRAMLGRFVCPAFQLKDLLELAKPDDRAELLSVSALGEPATDPGELLTHFRADLDAVERFAAAWDRDAVVDTIEVALPKGATVAQLHGQLPFVPEELADRGLAGFLEVPMSPRWRKDVAHLAETLHDFQHTQPMARLGMKLRCGGVTANAFPSEGDVAFFIARCREAHIPWKATAGLHHPRRHWDATLHLLHHGFLNVFATGLLAQTNAMTEADMTTLLSDREALALQFNNDGLKWGSWSCTTLQIAEYRKIAATSFGSCSFEEPCQDLAAMGLIST